jgi:hypothetical protein
VLDNNETTVRDNEMVYTVRATCTVPIRNLWTNVLCERKVMRRLRRPECRGEDIIKMDVIDYGVRLWTGFYGIGIMISLGRCEYGNEHYGSHKFREILY